MRYEGKVAIEVRDLLDYMGIDSEQWRAFCAEIGMQVFSIKNSEDTLRPVLYNIGLRTMRRGCCRDDLDHSGR
jgi:hypothetical protein